MNMAMPKASVVGGRVASLTVIRESRRTTTKMRDYRISWASCTPDMIKYLWVVCASCALDQWNLGADLSGGQLINILKCILKWDFTISAFDGFILELCIMIV